MLTASDIVPGLVALLFMGAAVGFLMAMEYRAQQRQHVELHHATLRRFDAVGVMVIRELRRPTTRPASIRREIAETDAALRADEEKPPAAPPDEGPPASASKGGPS